MKGCKFVTSFMAVLFLILAPVTQAQEVADIDTSATEESAGAVTNINTDDAETIAEVLDGVGMSRARAIIEYRNENGPFASAEELVEVSGIGERTLEANSEKIRVD